MNDASKKAMKAFESETDIAPVSSELRAINDIKQRMYTQNSVRIDDVSMSMQDRWPNSVMPFGMLLRFATEDFQNNIPIKEDTTLVVHSLVGVGFEDQSRRDLISNPSLMAKDELELIDLGFKNRGMKGLSAKEKKEGLSRPSIDNYLQLQAAGAGYGLHSADGLELRKVSYEVARHTPAMVMKERNDTQDTEKLAEACSKGNAIRQLALLLDPDSPDYPQKVRILNDFTQSITSTPVDKGLSVAENLVNRCLDAESESKVVQAVSMFLDGSTGTDNKSAKRASQKRKKGSGK